MREPAHGAAPLALAPGDGQVEQAPGTEREREQAMTVTLGERAKLRRRGLRTDVEHDVATARTRRQDRRGRALGFAREFLDRRDDDRGRRSTSERSQCALLGERRDETLLAPFFSAASAACAAALCRAISSVCAIGSRAAKVLTRPTSSAVIAALPLHHVSNTSPGGSSTGSTVGSGVPRR
jgi:hypothetical protein